MIWEQEYERGKPKYAVREAGSTVQRGTTVTFKPDPQIFQQTLEYNYDTLANRMRELSYLNKGITIEMVDRRSTDEKENSQKKPSIQKKG